MKKLLLALVILWSSFAQAQAQAPIPYPQSGAAGQFVTGVDNAAAFTFDYPDWNFLVNTPTSLVQGPQTAPFGSFFNGISSLGVMASGPVQFSDIQFASVFGAQTTSNSAVDIDYGNAVFTLNDATGFALDYTVQMQSSDDPTQYMYGIITGFSDTPGPATVTVLVTVPFGGGNFSNWVLQVIAGPNVGLPASAALGYSSDSFAIPARGDSVTFTTEPNKLFQSGSQVLVSFLGDSTQYWYGLVDTYNVTTGDISVFAQTIGTTASGTYNRWAIATINGVTQFAPNLATLSQSLTTPLVGIQSVTIQPGKSFQSGDSITLYSLTDATKFIYAFVDGYNVGSGALTFAALEEPALPYTDTNWNVVRAMTRIGGTYLSSTGPTVIKPIGPSIVSSAINFADHTNTANTASLYSDQSDANTELVLSLTNGTTIFNLNGTTGFGNTRFNLDSSIELDGKSHKLTLNADTTLNGTPGNVSTTGSPANGNLTKFTGAASISNADLTGDITTSGAVATTLATVNSNVGTFASVTVNAKGLATAAGNLTGDVTTSGAAATIANNAVTTAKINNSAVTYAKIQDETISTLIGRGSSAGVGPPQEITLGTGLSMSGTTLNSTSTGGVTTIFSGSVGTAATFVQTGIPATYSYLIIHCQQLSSNTATRFPRLSVSTNNGVSYDTTSASYQNTTVGGASPGFLFPSSVTQTAAQVTNGTVYLYGYQGGVYPVATVNSLNALAAAATGIGFASTTNYVGSTSAINAIQLDWNGSGNFDSGTITILGVK